MNVVTLIGIDLGKHSFHLHAQDAAGRMVFRKKLTRSQLLAQLANVPACTVVMEACAGGHANLPCKNRADHGLLCAAGSGRQRHPHHKALSPFPPVGNALFSSRCVASAASCITFITAWWAAFEISSPGLPLRK